MPFGFSAGPVQIATCNFPPRSCDLFTLPPHAPCRLQPKQIKQSGATTALCLHTLRADCNATLRYQYLLEATFASTRSVQIATACGVERMQLSIMALPPHAPCRLQLRLETSSSGCKQLCLHTLRADCNGHCTAAGGCPRLCLHTLRADCNGVRRSWNMRFHALPPHAPCRLQRLTSPPPRRNAPFASTRSVQIATRHAAEHEIAAELCLHTLRADCNDAKPLPRKHPSTLPPHAPCRLQLQKCTECNMHFLERVLSR